MQEERVYRSVRPRQLWFGVAAGPILWAIYLAVSYGLVTLHCQWRFFSFTVLSVPGIYVIVTVTTIVAAAPVLYAGYLAYGNWRRIEREGTLEGRVGERYHFLAYSGVLLSGLFFLVILVSWIPILAMSPCAGP